MVANYDVTAARQFSNDDLQVRIWEPETTKLEARMATALIEKWGMVAAVEDGEDSEGRAKARIMTPQEVVERACETASQAIAEFRARGWMVPLPSPDEARELLREQD